MAEYILELMCLGLFFWGVLGFDFREDRRCLLGGVGIMLICEIIVLMFPEYYYFLFALKFMIPSVVMPIIFNGRIATLIGMGICLIEIFIMLDSFYRGIWILSVKGDAMAVNLEMTYLLGETTCLVIAGLLSYGLRKNREWIRLRVEKINPVLFVFFIMCSTLMNYNPWYIGDTSTSLPQIIHGENLVKNGILTIAVTGIFCLIFILIIQKRELKRLVVLNERCIQEQTEQYRRVSQEDQSLRKFRHDYNAHIAALQAIVNNGDVDRMRAYVDTLSELKNKQRVVCTNNLVCDAILSAYVESCKAENIDFKVRGKFPESMSISDTDLCVLISNGISNAFEAVQKCTMKRKIRVNIGNSGDFIVITMINNAADLPIVKNGVLTTTKVEKLHHGIGTQNMQETAKKNSGSITWRAERTGEVITEIIIAAKPST